MKNAKQKLQNNKKPEAWEYEPGKDRKPIRIGMPLEEVCFYKELYKKVKDVVPNDGKWYQIELHFWTKNNLMDDIRIKKEIEGGEYCIGGICKKYKIKVENNN